MCITGDNSGPLVLKLLRAPEAPAPPAVKKTETSNQAKGSNVPARICRLLLAFALSRPPGAMQNSRFMIVVAVVVVIAAVVFSFVVK